jgi:hypothetical protein
MRALRLHNLGRIFEEPEKFLTGAVKVIFWGLLILLIAKILLTSLRGSPVI